MLPDSGDVAQSRAAVELDLRVRGLQQEHQNGNGARLTQNPRGPVWKEEGNVYSADDGSKAKLPNMRRWKGHRPT